MIKRKSTKGIKRKPYKKQNKGFEQYVAEVFCNRFNEMDVTQTKLIEDTGRKVTPATLSRVLKGNGGANINNVATIADMLGLEIIIRPKREEDECED